MNDTPASTANNSGENAQNGSETPAQNSSQEVQDGRISSSENLASNFIQGSNWINEFMTVISNANENGGETVPSEPEMSTSQANLAPSYLNGILSQPNQPPQNDEMLDVTSDVNPTNDLNGEQATIEVVQNGTRMSPGTLNGMNETSVSATSASLSASASTNAGSRPVSQEDDQPPKLEISVVGSPTVFGAQGQGQGSPNAEDERVIERCDVLQQAVNSTWPQGELNDSHKDPSSENAQECTNTSTATPTLAAPTSLPMPTPSIPPSPDTANNFFNINTALNSIFDFVRNAPPHISSNPEQFAQAMCQWRWYTIDGVQLPIVLRDGAQLIAVQIAHMKLLSKFPAHIPPEIQKRHVMVSIKLTPIEAWILNIVNATMCNFELGCYVFTTNDEMVDINAVERYYWVVKKHHLQTLRSFYENEIHNVKPDNWTLRAALIALRGVVEQSIEKADLESKKLESEAAVTSKAETPNGMNMSRKMSQTVSQ